MIVYRHLHSHDEIAPIADLEKLIWQMDDRGLVPEHLAQVIVHSGGCLIGAFEGERMAGFTLGLLARDAHGLHLWSHMAAVHPDYQSRGIGFGLKQAQRQWAIDQGLDRIGWTFDPLMRRNAHFNLRLLAATTHLYRLDFYGPMRDGLNAGFPSDRLIVTWRAQAERTLAHAAGQIAPVSAPPDAPWLVSATTDERPRLHPLGRAPFVRVAIPYDAPALRYDDPTCALAWREALAQALPHAFDQGYQAVDFAMSDGQCWYVLASPHLL